MIGEYRQFKRTPTLDKRIVQAADRLGIRLDLRPQNLVAADIVMLQGIECRRVHKSPVYGPFAEKFRSYAEVFRL